MDETIRCPYASQKEGEQGCGWTGTAKQLETHVCGYLPLMCRWAGNGCDQRLPRRDMAKHEEEECSKREVKCSMGECKVIVAADKRKGHWETCLYVPVLCPHGCTLKDKPVCVMRIELPAHLTVCPKVTSMSASPWLLAPAQPDETIGEAKREEWGRMAMASLRAALHQPRVSIRPEDIAPFCHLVALDDTTARCGARCRFVISMRWLGHPLLVGGCLFRARFTLDSKEWKPPVHIHDVGRGCYRGVWRATTAGMVQVSVFLGAASIKGGPLYIRIHPCRSLRHKKKA